MIRTFFTVITCILCSLHVSAQKEDEVLLTVGDEVVSRYEFEQIYLKNSQMMADTDKKSVDEYLDLFIVYKLKVAEAKAMGLNKKPEFEQELASYRKQLVQPHLIDKQTQNKLIKEAYERATQEVNASHILITVPEGASPEDTLNIYNKTLSIRDRILAGESFESVARATSDDPSVKMNGGNLGYFTVFQMVYPFESAAYKTPIGEVSMPVRSRFGYHIIKVHDKRPSPGQVKVAHIMMSAPQNATQEQKANAKHMIDSVYSLVLSNEDFGRLAQQFSQDPGTSAKGGELPWFGMRQMPPQFEKAAFSLNSSGEVHPPVQTQFGWHIIKLIDKKKVGSFEDMVPELQSRLARDERGRVSQEVFINHLKETNGFSVDSSALSTMTFILDSSFYDGNWVIPAGYADRILFEYARKKHTMGELAQKMIKNKSRYVDVPFSVIVDRCFNQFVNETVLEHQEQKLISENPEIRYLVKEYHDGILLFEIMNKNVWMPAANDQEGLKNYYHEHIEKYSWDQRVYAQKFVLSNERTLSKIRRYITSWRGRNRSDKYLINKFTQKADTLQIKSIALMLDDPMVVGFESWEDQVSNVKSDNGEFYFVRYNRTVKNDPIPLDEIRGQVISDYQDYLEKAWVSDLRNKYPVKVNQQVYQKVISNLN